MNKHLRNDKKFYESFRKKFVSNIFKLILEFYPDTKISVRINTDLNIFADEIIGSSESIMIKDCTLSESELEKELHLVERLLVNELQSVDNPVFDESIHHEVKKMLVDFYPEIFELSGNGLRLLERSSKMFCWEFVIGFHAQAPLLRADF